MFPLPPGEGQGEGKRDAGIARSAFTTLGAVRKQTIIAEDVASWDATVVAFATNNTLSFQATGAVGTSVRWVATVRTAEVSY